MKTRQALPDIYCSQELIQGLDNQVICLSVINILLAITAIVGNALILIALESLCGDDSFSDRLGNVFDNSSCLLHGDFLQAASSTNPSS